MTRLLIVDDEYGLAELMSEMLSERGYDVTIAINGRLGLRVLDEKRIDLVIVDAMMPILDGLEMVAQMHADPEHAEIPAILMTTLASEVPDEDRHAYQTVLQKPFTSASLVRAVEDALPLRDPHPPAAVEAPR
jgi:CheY-like chemotaxis protein